MMTRVSIYLIKAYRFFFSPDTGILFRGRMRTCRFYPSCSEYAITALSKHGFLKGWWYALRRVGRCHPFSKTDIYDPVQ
jgi:uncharacterized protein